MIAEEVFAFAPSLVGPRMAPGGMLMLHGTGRDMQKSCDQQAS
jgi:hypothetical protein